MALDKTYYEAEEERMNMNAVQSYPGTTLACIAAILGTAYSIFLVRHFYGGTISASEAGDAAGAIGAGIATALVTPHMLMAALGSLFAWIGVFLKTSCGFILTAGILFSVGVVVFPVYAAFVIVQAILCYVAFARRRKAIKNR